MRETAVLRPNNETVVQKERPQADASDEGEVSSPPIVTIDLSESISSPKKLKASFDGFRLVLIGDMHEQPMLHLKVKPFIVGAKDWSGELSATTTLATQISYWNLTNSHWEPLIDPWRFSILVGEGTAIERVNLRLLDRERSIWNSNNI
ncbi:hypothetical protein MPER_01853, partial [Moniliophthora perniciosa FA553]